MAAITLPPQHDVGVGAPWALHDALLEAVVLPRVPAPARTGSAVRARRCVSAWVHMDRATVPGRTAGHDLSSAEALGTTATEDRLRAPFGVPLAKIAFS